MPPTRIRDLANWPQGALGKLLVPEIMKRYTRIMDVLRDFDMRLPQFRHLIKGERSRLLSREKAERMASVLGMEKGHVEQLLRAHAEDMRQYPPQPQSRQRDVGFPVLLPKAGALGRVVLPVMIVQQRTLDSVVEALHVSRNYFMKLMRGEVVFFPAHRTVIEVVIELAVELKQPDPFVFIEAYLGDSLSFYTDMVFLLRLQQESDKWLGLPPAFPGGARVEEELSQALWVLTMLRKVQSSQDRARLVGLVQAFVSGGGERSGRSSTNTHEVPTTTAK